MRPILAVAAVFALAFAGVAQAGVRMHVPHKHRHDHDRTPASADTPVSDIPEPVWTSKPRG